MLSTPSPTWEDIKWLREIWGGPFMIKGMIHPDKASLLINSHQHVNT